MFSTKAWTLGQHEQINYLSLNQQYIEFLSEIMCGLPKPLKDRLDLNVNVMPNYCISQSPSNTARMSSHLRKE